MTKIDFNYINAKNFGSTQWSVTAPTTTLPTGNTANGFSFFNNTNKVTSGTTIYDEYFISAGRTLTLTGTSGTANINILGVNYLITFLTDLTTTAINFVTANQTTLLNLGIQLFSNSNVIKFGRLADNTGGSLVLSNITINTISGNLNGTFSTAINDHLVIPYTTKPYNNTRLNHFIRINFNIDAGNLQYYALSLRRWQNDTTIGSIIQISRNTTLTGQQEVFISYTANSLDPFVTGGFYFALENNTGQNVTISGVAGILIETFYQKPILF